MDGFSSQIENIASTYVTDTIFILGKGPSIDQIRPETFAGSLVIGLNDAERIVPADISIFHADWVQAALAESGFQSQLYVTSTNFHPLRGRVARAPYVPMSQDSSDLMMQRFLTDEFVIEDVLFLSALKIARMVARIRKRPQAVYMVGFDFSSGQGYSHAIDRDFALDDAEEKSARISLQEYFFVNTLYFLKNSDLNVIHVGDRPFSVMSPVELNAQFGPPAHHHAVDGGSRAAIVAELTTNHFGDRTRLERMIRAARAAGADYVKLQKRDVESFYSKEQLDSAYVSPFGPTFRDYRNALELSLEDFGFVDDLCKSLGIKWFASVLDEPSFRFMLEIDPGIVKLPSTISEHTDYLAYVARNYRGEVVLSTGMTGQEYERWVLDTFVHSPKLHLLQCNSAYPTPHRDCHVAVVRHYHELSRTEPRIVPGYSSHDHGWLASALAVAAGAQMLEKHVKLGNTEWAHFDAVAVDLTTPAFKEYVDRVREAEMIVGREEKQVTESEHHKYFRRA
ncbi:N-acetylneuraminate synthase family protein [Sphingomonas canadensis]|uniref:N-acetylneuraminate synthase family protein n=1 Tax=Sphingomonas canadensis TaxID=1219257 RepID=A0ABW3HAN5_9SPHN|nr:N-acetylneuraminate synthase family protein [Sphingomonas canadensis]MCW3837122.1 N-acetylneuraminate synthase family protein [Sphingomonas canadensis]